jgi:hypothetical protein
MSVEDNNKESVGFSFWPHGVLILLIVVVVALFVLSYVEPIIPQQFATLTPALTETAAPENISQPDEIGQDQDIVIPLTEEEIGSTDGIVFWSTILILILLVGTLRETLRRKGQ